MSAYGLTPRPELGPEEMAALVVALEHCYDEPAALVPAPAPVASWRFSGRWFNSGPFDRRRPRR